MPKTGSAPRPTPAAFRAASVAFKTAAAAVDTVATDVFSLDAVLCSDDTDNLAYQLSRAAVKDVSRLARAVEVLKSTLLQAGIAVAAGDHSLLADVEKRARAVARPLRAAVPAIAAVDDQILRAKGKNQLISPVVVSGSSRARADATTASALLTTALEKISAACATARPAQLKARRFAQGPALQLASRRKKLPAHKAWHVVQQKQGRVKPTLQLKRTPTNTTAKLERAADALGRKAAKSSVSVRRARVSRLSPMRDQDKK